MAIQIYDADQVLFSGSLRTSHDGLTGSYHDQKIYIRNDDASKYYTYVQVQIASTGPAPTAWVFKTMYGERQPTEAEWDTVASLDALTMPDIGAPGNPDTSTLFPVWIRIYCPGGTLAQQRTSESIRVYYIEEAI